MYSALFAAVDSITPAHFSELPVERAMKSVQQSNRSKKVAKEAIEKLRGRVDLWCQWKDLEFLLELKQIYMSLKQTHNYNGLHGRWERLVQQIKDVKDHFANLCD
jgi:hypothetical protein